MGGDQSTGGVGGAADGLAQRFTRSDDLMLLRVIERADAEDFEIRELRGWAWQHIARILANPHTPLRTKLRAAQLVTDRTDPLQVDADRRPVSINVAIISTEAARHPTPVNGHAVRFLGGNGDGA